MFYNFFMKVTNCIKALYAPTMRTTAAMWAVSLAKFRSAGIPIAVTATCALAIMFSSCGLAASTDKWVRSPNVSVRIGTNGEIDGLRYSKGDTLQVHGRTTIPGCQEDQKSVVWGKS